MSTAEFVRAADATVTATEIFPPDSTSQIARGFPRLFFSCYLNQYRMASQIQIYHEKEVFLIVATLGS
jgi:hypothetical protein